MRVKDLGQEAEGVGAVEGKIEAGEACRQGGAGGVEMAEGRVEISVKMAGHQIGLHGRQLHQNVKT